MSKIYSTKKPIKLTEGEEIVTTGKMVDSLKKVDDEMTRLDNDAFGEKAKLFKVLAPQLNGEDLEFIFLTEKSCTRFMICYSDFMGYMLDAGYSVEIKRT